MQITWLLMKVLAVESDDELTKDLDEYYNEPQADRDEPNFVGNDDVPNAVQVSPGARVQNSQGGSLPLDPHNQQARIDTSAKRKPSQDEHPRKSSKKPKKKGKENEIENAVTVVLLDGRFLQQTYEKWRSDPFSSSLRVISQYREVNWMQYEKKLGELRVQLYAEKTARLALEDSINKKKESSSKERELLETAKNNLKIIEKQKNDAVTRAETAEERVKELEETIKGLETNAEESSLKRKSLEDQITELEEQPGSQGTGSESSKFAELQDRLKRTATALRESKVKVKEAGEKGLRLYNDGFEEALKQIKLVYPDFEFDKEIIGASHVFEGNEIVHVNLDT